MIQMTARKSLSGVILDHMLRRVSQTSAEHEPFSHIYFEDLFPGDVYDAMMAAMPDASFYKPISADKHYRSDGVSTRDVLPLTAERLAQLRPAERELWQGVATALAAPELKSAVFKKLAPDLAARFKVPQQTVDQIESHCKPSLFRDLEGYAIPPHPDGRAKVVTMQLYLPCDRSQLDLGTALYKRHLTSLSGLLSWKGRFKKVKQFSFQPNSGYAFAVSNSLTHKSWHGRDTLPPGSGVRNSILNIYFAEEGREY